MARLSHSKEQYSLEPVDLASLVCTAAENLQAAASERKVKLDVSRLPEHPVRVMGNHGKLVQLVDNLLVNAIKYNKENGEVRLELKREGAKPWCSVWPTLGLASTGSAWR